MNKSTFYNHIFKDNHLLSFGIPIAPRNLQEPEVWLDTLEKMVNFHSDYIKISQQHRIGEFYGIEYLNNLDFDFVSVYEKKLRDHYHNTGSLSFFPNIEFGKISLKYPYATYLYYHNNKGEVVSDYIYDLYDLCTLEMVLNKPYRYPTQVIDIDVPYGVFLGDDYSWYVDEEAFVSFSLGLSSDLFHPVMEWGYQKDANLAYDLNIDNRVLAYRNAPRYNSYLRDLKRLVIDKYGWKVSVFDEELLNNHKYENTDGVLLDGKIIYQEDIDNGFISIPDEFIA